MNRSLFAPGRRPFRPAASPDLFFAADSHAAAADRLRAAHDAGEGVALLDGGPGTGKTLAALRLLESLADAPARVFVPASRFDRPAELYQAVLFDLGKPFAGLSENELRLAVTEHILASVTAGHRAVVVLDEAHLMGPVVLEEVRLLDNLEGRGAKAAFTLLVGLPMLRDNLAAPGLEALAQRIACRVRLVPLAADESVEFLKFQIAKCGGSADRMLTAEAADLMADLTGGVPRVLNQLAAAAVALALEAGQATIDAEAVCEAADRLGLSPAPSDESAFAAESGPGEAGDPGGTGEPGDPGRPKQKARKRRAA